MLTELFAKGDAYDFQALVKTFLGRFNSIKDTQFFAFAHNKKWREANDNSYGLGYETASRDDNPIYIKLTRQEFSGVHLEITALTVGEKTFVSLPDNDARPFFEEFIAGVVSELERLDLRIINQNSSLALQAFQQGRDALRQSSNTRAIENLTDEIRKTRATPEQEQTDPLEEIPDIGWHREAIRLWNGGKSAKEISSHFGGSPSAGRVWNVISELRKEYPSLIKKKKR